MLISEYLTQTKTRLALYITAEQKVLLGQSYSIGNRTLTRADLEEIRMEITNLSKLCLKLTRGNGRGIRVQRVVPRDI